MAKLVKIEEKEYDLDFFKKNDFVRKQCIKCGRFFWTQNKDLKTCQDAPCEEYSFIGLRKEDIGIDFVRAKFIEYFKERGHTYIEPRPVLARWRDDIYLTIASIAVFQPFVTSGIIDPPANPLVMSQPCMRLKDLDLVGLTAGRHLTIFEMAAHHAFNSKERYVYWKDETTAYCHEMNTFYYKIDPSTVTYIEEVWEGGGNAGPCLEVATKGLEIATLVFMKYKVENGNYIDMPLFIVDTGYGMERYTWYLSGEPTVFHSLYKRILIPLIKKIGLNPYDELIFEHAKASVLYSAGKDRSEVIKRIKERLNLREEIREIIAKIESIYAVLDHTKSIIFMLADGLVPSNSGEGYLGRLLIRRTLKHLFSLKIDTSLREIIEEQIKLWSGFKNIKNAKERIREIIEIEEEKFNSLLQRSALEISSLIKNKIEKGEKIKTEELIELYDSQGIQPEFVIEEALKKGLEVEMPKDFFSRVVAKHERPIKEEAKEIPKIPPLKDTIALYYEDPYMAEFEAKIIAVVEPKWIILDKTAFYPEGGGQVYDTGYLIVEDRKLRVINVQKFDNVILHEIEGNVSNDLQGKEVKGIIDYERRKNIMRHHTATHILLYSIRKILGDHIWQAGVRKEEDKARLDVTHYKRISKEEVNRIEDLANEIVLSKLPVRTRFMDRKEAEEKYGFSLYQGGVMGGKIIRVVSIENLDHQACGGTHVKDTSEVGLIKIIKTERIQDGVERFIFTAGKASLEKFRELESSIEAIAENLQLQREKIVEGSLRLAKEIKKERKDKERLREILAETISSKIEAIKAKGFNIYEYIGKELSSEELALIGEKILKKDQRAIALLGSMNEKALCVIMLGESVLEKYAANDLIKIVAEKIKGGGGGRRDFAQAGGIYKEGLINAFKEIKRIILS